MRLRPQNLAAATALLIALGIGSYLRTAQLDLRPMHTDEAIQAERLGTLMGGGGFQYNPHDGHGPGLLYLSIPVAWLAGASSYGELSEPVLRLTPALCGIALVLAAALFWGPLGGVGVGAAALLAALSPMHVYYSRYYIMELPLVLLLALFLFCLWRYFTKPAAAWMVGAAICGAWMHATKETFVISIAALAAAVAVAALCEWRRDPGLRMAPLRPLAVHLAVGLAVSVALSAALYSVFFTEPAAIVDSYTTYLNYLDRAGGSGHEKPSTYYLGLLWWREMELFNWSEAMVLALAGVGALAAAFSSSYPRDHRIFLRVLAVYAVVTLLIYSVIAYKTPWSILAFLHAATLLAGAGASFLFQRARPLGRAVLGLAFAAGCWHLFQQDRVANFQFPAHGDRNPYAYSHTSPRLVNKLVAQVAELRAIEPELSVQVFHPETGWPLPYYFRDIGRAGYYPAPGAEVFADVVIADEEFSAALGPLLGDRYIGPDLCNLRDNVMLHIYIEKELFSAMVDRRTAASQ